MVRRFSLPEPEPIVVDQATFDRARRLLDAVAHGTFDRSELAPQLSVPLSSSKAERVK
jgi:hypothetical protein